MNTIRRSLSITLTIAVLLFTARAASADVHSYNVRVSSLDVYNTRSRHNDTVYVKFRVYVNGSNLGDHDWDGAGGRDMNNGNHTISAAGSPMSFNTGPLNDGDVISWEFVIINSGSDPNADKYKAAADAVAAQVCKDIWSCAGGAAGAIFVNWAFTNCDGPLAADKHSVRSDTMNGLINSNGHNGEYNWNQRYPGKDSPTGCGSNSDYGVNVGFKRTS